MKKLSALCALLLLSAPAQAVIVDLIINFDDYPIDISWTVELADSGEEVASGGDYPTVLAGETLQTPLDLLPAEYEFTIFDSYGDGLCCNEGPGNYGLYLGLQPLYESNGMFGAGETIRFTVPAVPLPASLPLLAAGLAGLGFFRNRNRSA